MVTKTLQVFGSLYVSEEVKEWKVKTLWVAMGHCFEYRDSNIVKKRNDQKVW